jgi:hypothetical protein
MRTLYLVGMAPPIEKIPQLPVEKHDDKLLAKYRRVRNKADLPPLNRKTILEWAELHKRRTGKWPLAPTQGRSLMHLGKRGRRFTWV